MKESLETIIGKNDESLSKREDALIKKINSAYEKAVRAAIHEFRALENVAPNKKVSSQEVRKILTKVLDEFSKEYNEILAPLRGALLESYEEGLKETAQILAIKDAVKKEESKK